MAVVESATPRNALAAFASCGIYCDSFRGFAEPQPRPPETLDRPPTYDLLCSSRKCTMNRQLIEITNDTGFSTFIQIILPDKNPHGRFRKAAMNLDASQSVYDKSDELTCRSPERERRVCIARKTKRKPPIANAHGSGRQFMRLANGLR